MSPTATTTKSFLDSIVDGIVWNDEEDDDEYSSDSSFSDDEEEDEVTEDDMDVEQPAAANNNNAMEENQPPAEAAEPLEQPTTTSHPSSCPSLSIEATNKDMVMSKLRDHPRNQELLFRVAQAEEVPLLAEDVDWDLLTSQIKTYPAAELGDDVGSVLLQGILRVNPPATVVQKAVSVFPKSCVDMRAFYAACQYGYQRNDDVVELVMHHTLESRRKEGIQWGMLAFLGDARVRTRHARILLKGSPTAVVDPQHGVHNVSPLDRMMSGALIHGDDIEWAEKLKLALLTAKFGSVDSAMAREDAGGRGWFPFHSLLRRLISKDFQGVKFGKYTFLRTLSACLRSGFSFSNVDRRGNLPIHTAVGRECETNLGTAGERKLLKYLLQAHPAAAVTRSGEGMLPLRLAIQNGWLAHDLIIDACPQALHTKNDQGDLAIHVALSGKYHPRFGVNGAREIVKYLLREYPRAASIPDSKGRLPLHLALENGWPCHDLLVAAAPQALQMRDVTNGLYPFQISAVALETAKEEEKENDKEAALRNLSILYELIRHDPTMLDDSGVLAKSRNGGKKKKLESFLEDVKDTGLTLDKEEVHEEEEDSSDDSSDEEEEEEDNVVQQPSAPAASSSGAAAAAAATAPNAGQQNMLLLEEADVLPYEPASMALVVANTRAHARGQELLFKVVRSGDEPLVRGDIDWSQVASQLKTYPAAELGDERGSVLLQGILRMDPPAFVVQKVVALFPMSCVDMEAFYAACQFGSFKNDNVVELVMHHTLEERRKEGIRWGMLAFLGDARIRIRHARVLLKGAPTAVIDPDYGVLGVSPLDRMISGALIHGDDIEWAEKLKLALLTAKFGSVDSAMARDAAGGRGWFPFHSLLKRLTSKDFTGVRFGRFTFLRTLSACLRTGFSCQNVDRRGNLPIHSILGRECNTNLESAGERKLIKFLLQAHPGAATTRDGEGALPLRLAIQNGWPCYDIIVDASPQSIRTRDENGDLAIHVALSGKYHPRFGIRGARNIVRYFLEKNPGSAGMPDGKGRLPLHLAMENVWPCHDILMAAEPRALETRDISNKLYPFQIAACALQTSEEYDKEKSLEELSVLFELIDYGPTALTRCFDDGNWVSRKRKRPEEEA